MSAAPAEDPLFSRFGREYPAGTVLFREGEGGREMFVVQSGTVHITKQVRGVEQLITRAGPGEFFGELALLNQKPRNATAMVAETARVLVIDPRTFEVMIRGNLEIAARLIRKLAARLDAATEQIELLMLADPMSRVVHLFCHQGRESGGGDVVSLPFGPAELASKVALLPEQVEDVLRRLEQAGLASATSTSVEISSLSRLEDYLGYLDKRDQFGSI